MRNITKLTHKLNKKIGLLAFGEYNPEFNCDVYIRTFSIVMQYLSHLLGFFCTLLAVAYAGKVYSFLKTLECEFFVLLVFLAVITTSIYLLFVMEIIGFAIRKLHGAYLRAKSKYCEKFSDSSV